MRAWHFVGETLRDGSPIPADGVPLKYDRPIHICESGYHASLNPFDALQYAPGNTLCLVDVSGKTIHQSDKLVAEERTIIVRMDATTLLHWYAKQQALSVIHLWNPPEIVLDFLMGDDEAAQAAQAAAQAAARGAA